MTDAPKKEATMDVVMLRNYQATAKEKWLKGSFQTVPKSLAAKLIKGGVASADAAV